MFKRLKILTLPLLALIIVALSLSGCGGKAAQTEDTSQLDLPQIVSDAMLALKNVSSYTYSLDMNIDMEATGGSSPGQATAKMESSGTADFTAKNMQMDLDMSVEQSDTQPGDTPMNVSAEMYMMGDTLYIKTDIPGAGEQWVKTALTEEMKQAYDLDLVDQQLAPLEDATQIEYVKTETVDGSECYVLKIVPDMAAMKEWLDEQQVTSGPLDWSQVQKLEDVFKELAYNTWIAKDTKLIKKMNIQISIELNAAQFGVDESEFEKMTMDAEINMLMNDYHEPVTITLPDEAQNATEMPQS